MCHQCLWATPPSLDHRSHSTMTLSHRQSATRHKAVIQKNLPNWARHMLRTGLYAKGLPTAFPGSLMSITRSQEKWTPSEKTSRQRSLSRHSCTAVGSSPNWTINSRCIYKIQKWINLAQCSKEPSCTVVTLSFWSLVAYSSIWKFIRKLGLAKESKSN